MERWHKAIIFSLILNFSTLIAFGAVFNCEPAEKEELELVEVYLSEDLDASDAENKGISGMSSSDDITFSENKKDIFKKESISYSEVVSENKVSEIKNNSVGTSQGTSSNSEGFGQGNSSNTNGFGSGSIGGSGEANVITRGQVLKRVEPNYPQSAREKGINGTVVLKVKVLKNGIPENVIINSSSGYSQIDEAAVNALYKWRFSPAKNGLGEAVACSYNISIQFNLKG